MNSNKDKQTCFRHFSEFTSTEKDLPNLYIDVEKPPADSALNDSAVKANGKTPLEQIMEQKQRKCGEKL